MSTAADLDFDRLLDGQVALITGAASGQGRAAARCSSARHGARVVVADVNDEGSRETVRLLEERRRRDRGARRRVAAAPTSARWSPRRWSGSAASTSSTTTRRCR